MTVQELYDRLTIHFPPALSCDWDHDGLTLCPDLSRTVKRVLCTLDLTEAAIQKAVQAGADVILSHHPFLFHMPEAITPKDAEARKMMTLLEKGISALSFHTCADAAAGGVSDLLAARLSLADVYTPEGESILRVGALPRHMSGRELALLVKEQLGTPAVTLCNAGEEVRYVAVCGGEGKDMIDAVRATGAHAFVCGRAGYHAVQDAAAATLTVVEAGHFYTEAPIVERFAQLVEQIGGIEAIRFVASPIDVL